MKEGNCDLGTLASSFNSEDELADENNVKVAVREKLTNGKFSKAIDIDSTYAEAYFYRAKTYIKGAFADYYPPAINDCEAYCAALGLRLRDNYIENREDGFKFPLSSKGKGLLS